MTTRDQSTLIASELLEVLRCPLHPGDGALQLATREDGATYGSNSLCCPQGCSYPIRDGIPDMVPSDVPYVEDLEEESAQWDRHALHYDRRWWDEVYKAGAAAAAAALGPKPGDLILEAACGTGLVFKRYRRDDIRVVALDLSLESLRFLRETLKGAAPILVRGALEHLPFCTGAFSRVLCANALQHVSDDERRRVIIRELARVARPGSRVVISAHNYSILKKRAGITKVGTAGSPSGRVRYTYRFEAAEFRALLTSALTVERIYGAGLPLLYRFKLSPISRLLERVVRRWSGTVRWANMLVGVSSTPLHR